MSDLSASPSQAASTSSRSETAPPTWTCASCQAEGMTVELIESEGNIVCPQCAVIDTTATSANTHVDLDKTSGLIVDPIQALRTLQTAWGDRSTWVDRNYMSHVDLFVATHIYSIVGNSSYNLLNGTRLWFTDLRRAEQIDSGSKTMSVYTKTPRLVLQVGMAVRMACQEMNLISMYNKLKGKRLESRGVVRGYTKGDDRVPVLSLQEYFDLSQKLPSSSPGRINAMRYWRDGHKRYHDLIGYKLAPCDYSMSLVNRVITYLQTLVQASSSERLALLTTTPAKPKPVWPDGILDDFKRIKDWDEVFRTVYELWQAQNCVSLFAYDIPAVQATSAVALTIMACEGVIGEVVRINNSALETELAARLRVGVTGVKTRRGELDRFVLSWSTSLSELRLPVPEIKPSKRSSILGAGNSGWGSDKRRGVPKKVIMPLAVRIVAAHWKEIKRVRLARPGIIPVDEECALARKLFAGHDIQQELADQLAEAADPLLPSADSDWGSDTESECSFASPSEAGLVSYVGDYATYTNPKYRAESVASSSRRFWKNATQSPAPSVQSAPRALLDPEQPQPTINKPGMVQAWIENGDASSTEDGDSSDDEINDDDTPQPAAKRARRDLDRSQIGELPQPFAFSIGKKGFSVEKGQMPSLPTPAPTPGPVSSSAIPSRNTSRAQSVASVQSDNGMDAGSESGQNARQPSVTPSAISATSSAARRPAPLRATLTPAPATFTNGALPSARAEREAIRRGRKHPNDHTGVLIREKKLYFNVGRTLETLRHAANVPADTDVIKSIQVWIDKQKPLASNPPLPTGHETKDLRDLIQAHAEKQSSIETILRAGYDPKEIPQDLLPRSVSATNMDLFHYADRKAILGEGEVVETEALRDLSQRLFFRGYGNDTLPEVFLTDEEVETRITSYHYKGHWDVLDDPSPCPVPKFRKRKREIAQVPSNMTQRLASEFERGFANEHEEEDAIQQAVLAGLLVVKPLAPWDPYKVTASVPSLWYIDDLFELNLVDRSKLDPQAAWETAQSTWNRRRRQEDRGEIDMPPPEGAGAEHLAQMGCVIIDGVVTKQQRQQQQ